MKNNTYTYATWCTYLRDATWCIFFLALLFTHWNEHWTFRSSHINVRQWTAAVIRQDTTRKCQKWKNPNRQSTRQSIWHFSLFVRLFVAFLLARSHARAIISVDVVVDDDAVWIVASSFYAIATRPDYYYHWIVNEPVENSQYLFRMFIWP